MAQIPNLPQELRTVQVFARFGMRMIVLTAFAAFGGGGFGRSMAALLWMSATLSAVVATFKRESPVDIVLNHWDEAAAYAALFSLVTALNHDVVA